MLWRIGSVRDCRSVAHVGTSRVESLKLNEALGHKSTAMRASVLAVNGWRRFGQSAIEFDQPLGSLGDQIRSCYDLGANMFHLIEAVVPRQWMADA
jgi:hypothetical protein